VSTGDEPAKANVLGSLSSSQAALIVAASMNESSVLEGQARRALNERAARADDISLGTTLSGRFRYINLDVTAGPSSKKDGKRKRSKDDGQAPRSFSLQSKSHSSSLHAGQSGFDQRQASHAYN
jgi:hypothetical protein